jgi:hypothetical protein
MLAAALIAGCPDLAAAQDWTFESGTLRGWTRTGTAFDNQPTFWDNIRTRRPGETAGQEGSWWIGTYENRPVRGHAPGDVQGDGPVGALLSDPFTIRTGFVSFLLGGGSDITRERVELLVALRGGEQPPPMRPDGIGGRISLPDGDYSVRVTAAGEGREAMRLVQWAIVRYAGRKARIRIVDKGSGDWDHINVDDFEFADAAIATVVPGAVLTPRTGRFRITARGFRVNHQSYDDALNRDGWGDEVFVRADVFQAQPGGDLVRGATLRTVKIGELVTGGSYPTDDPAIGRGGALRGSDLPLMIWQGPLTEGGGAVVILPSIWEWDGAEADAEERRWETSLRPALAARQGDIARLMSQHPAGGESPRFRVSLSMPITDEGTRPIGSPGRRNPSVPMAVNAIVLTYKTAQALADNLVVESLIDEGTIVYDARRLPRGVLPVEFNDGPGLDGWYTLYVYVERLP